MTDTALVLTGGHSHPPELSTPALTAVLAESGLAAVVDQDIEASLSDLTSSRPEVVVVNALRWTMSHPRHAEHRERWALSLSESARAEVDRWVRAGGPLLALHTALVSFDDWPGWADLIGGAWDWERSSHPPVGPVEVRGVADHPVSATVGAFTVTDECYVDLDLRDDSEVIATMSTEGVPPQPAVWLREVGRGRVATSALGHDRRSLDDPSHRALLGHLLGWLLEDRTSTP